MSAPHIVLVGNGPYANRGCEAIVRGTMEILRATFGQVNVTLGTFGRPALVKQQSREETDPGIRHFPLSRGQRLARWTVPWLRHQILRLLGSDGAIDFETLRRMCTDTDLALQIGGDNYSLDYGVPSSFMALDRWFYREGLPVVLWGASVGPFDRLPGFEKKIIKHLKRMDLILVRESESYKYLTGHGLTENVRLMPDPAFLMTPAKPPESCFPWENVEELIGLSLSPLMARYVLGGNLFEWTRRCADIVSSILKSGSGRHVMLVPHVINEYDPWSNDLAFLENVVSLLRPDEVERVILLPPLSAAEYKWLIGQCTVFAGARTHSTIASFSQCVPTVSLAYSIKAVGLNRDLLGTLDYCILPHELSAGAVVERIQHALMNKTDLRQRLAEKMESLTMEARNAGTHLRNVLDARR